VSGEIALCPFCGCQVGESSFEFRWQFSRAVLCQNCGAIGPKVEVRGNPGTEYREAEAEAIRKWNGRAVLVTYTPGEQGSITVNGASLDNDTEHALRSAIDSLEYHNALLREGGGKLLARAEAAESRLDKVREFVSMAVSLIKGEGVCDRDAVLTLAREVLGEKRGEL
jgi:hypothetical protein